MIKLLALLVLVFFGSPPLAVHALDIAVVMSSDAKPYHEALEGFRDVVQHPIVSVQTLTPDPSSWRVESKKLRSRVEPDLVFVLGTSALQAVSGDVKNIPVVHALAFIPFSNAVASSKNVYGISMIPSTDQAISLLRELNPKIRRVGTIYDASRSALLFSQARAAFQKSGLQLIGSEARSAGEIGAALKSLESGIEMLWLWPDERFLAEEILQRVFLFSFERKIPVLGLSERHTDMGALLSLFYGSARDLGVQAGELANRVLAGATASLPSLTIPRQVKLTVNLKTARKLDIKLPDSIVRRADYAIKAPVYKEGDWWVFRIKMIDPNGATKTEVHQVVFSKNSFESDDPSFLTGSDNPGTPNFLPFASVYLTDPQRRWLDFPLLPGKTWSFRYPLSPYRRSGSGVETGHTRWANAEAEVVGKASRLLETPAGKFEAIEIWRNEYVNEDASLTYFYSPQTRSVVKLSAQAGGSYYQRRYELELIAYGNGGSMGKDKR